jgi:hypothetical protein
MEFDSWDDAQEAMRKAEEVANSKVMSRQRDIVYGSHWVRPFEEGLEFGYVLPEGEGGSADTYRRGYRFSQCSSILGEGIGDVHLSVLWPIEKEEYDLAKANGWRLLHEDWEKEMLLRITHEIEQGNAELQSARPSDPGSPQEGS